MAKEEIKGSTDLQTATREERQADYTIPSPLKEVINDSEWYKTLVETMAQGMIASDLNHVIVFVNPALCEMFGYEKEEMLGEDILKFVVEEDREKVVRQTERRYEEKNSSQYEVTMRTKLGSSLPVLVTGTPIIGRSGKTIGTYAIITDITDRKIAEKEVRDKNAELQELYNNLLELYEQLGVIISESTRIHGEILLFTSKDCVYCAPAERVLQEVLASYGGKITYRKVDIDEEPDLAEEHDIMSLPTIAIGEEQITSVPDVYRLHSMLFSALVPEEKFRRTRQELDNIIKHSPIAIMTINDEGIVTGINPTAELLVGDQRKNVVGKNVFEDEIGKPNPTPQKMLNLYKRGLKGEKVTIDRLYIKELDFENPEPFTILSFKIVPMTDKEGEIAEILVLAEDVTEKALQEEKLARSHKKLEELNEKLVQINKERANFVEITTKGLISPLRSSRELIDQILSGRLGRLGDETIGIMEYLRSNLENVSKKLMDIFDFSMMEVQGFALEFKVHNVKDLVSEALQSVGSTVIDKGFIVFLEIPDELEVKCDRDQIIKVLNNLITNGIKFTEKDCTIQISAEEWSEDMLKISVKDNGIGIAEEDLERIFDQYYKVDPNTDGSGLGLTVVKSIVEAHNGTIWAESEGYNKGSTFSFTLPKADEEIKPT